MADTTTVVALPSTSNSNSYIEWGSVIGGAVLAAALSFVLLTFGTSGGFASVSPYSWNNPSATILSLLGAIYFLIVMIASAIAGGYFAGRFRKPVGDSFSRDESEVRDGAHGLLVWAVGMLVGVIIAAMGTSAVVRGAATAAGDAAVIAGQNASSDSISRMVDTMLRPAPQAGSAGAVRPEDSRAVVTRILQSGITQGQINDDDRAYVARLVSSQTAISEDEARRRVDATIEQAKRAADQARKAAAILAFLIGAASIVSAGAAYWAATAGGEARDQSLNRR